MPENEDLPRPNGILIVGLPGTGKSLSCNASASMFGWPLIRLDIGGLKNSLVGELERIMRQATAVGDDFGNRHQGKTGLMAFFIKPWLCENQTKGESLCIWLSPS
ncbi:MAG: AAA family ATPase [Desulfatibacillum sp.]|nr:AAA family ATPase [Desulfatibacillum sp.]